MGANGVAIWLQKSFQGTRRIGSCVAMASDMVTPDLLARCYSYLEDQGLGILELATLDAKDLGDIARQIGFELNVPVRSFLEEAVYNWIRDATPVPQSYFG